MNRDLGPPPGRELSKKRSLIFRMGSMAKETQGKLASMFANGKESTGVHQLRKSASTLSLSSMASPEMRSVNKFNGTFAGTSNGAPQPTDNSSVHSSVMSGTSTKMLLGFGRKHPKDPSQPHLPQSKYPHAAEAADTNGVHHHIDSASVSSSGTYRSHRRARSDPANNGDLSMQRTSESISSSDEGYEGSGDLSVGGNSKYDYPPVYGHHGVGSHQFGGMAGAPASTRSVKKKGSLWSIKPVREEETPDSASLTDVASTHTGKSTTRHRFGRSQSQSSIKISDVEVKPSSFLKHRLIGKGDVGKVYLVVRGYGASYPSLAEC